MTVFDYSNRISLLDLSYNQIHELPPQIGNGVRIQTTVAQKVTKMFFIFFQLSLGELALLRELRAAFNKLTSVPTEIGKLKRLRKLVINGNKIKILPVEIGRLGRYYARLCNLHRNFSYFLLLFFFSGHRNARRVSGFRKSPGKSATDSANDGRFVILMLLLLRLN